MHARYDGNLLAAKILHITVPNLRNVNNDLSQTLHELWLLDAGGGMPLARPETAVDAARERPLATSEVFRPYPPVLDLGGLRVARVKAQLRGGAPRPEGLTEPFYAFSTE